MRAYVREYMRPLILVLYVDANALAASSKHEKSKSGIY